LEDIGVHCAGAEVEIPWLGGIISTGKISIRDIICAAAA